MHESWNWRVAVLAERVFHHGGEGLLLRADRNHLAANRIIRVFRVDQANEVRGDVDAELPLGGEAFALVVGEFEDLADLFERVDAVAELPTPVIPLLVRHIGPLWGAAATEWQAVRTKGLGWIARIHPGGIGGGDRGGVALKDLRCVHLVPPTPRRVPLGGLDREYAR